METQKTVDASNADSINATIARFPCNLNLDKTRFTQ